MRTDVIVVGAGPVGLLAAQAAAEQGVGVVVVEEHRRLGYPPHCAGLLGARGLRLLGLSLPSHIIENTVKGAVFHSPSGLRFEIEAREARAVVVHREEFHEFLANRAVDAGADLVLGHRARELLISNSGVSIDNRFQADVLIVCEGSRFQLARQLGFSRPRKVLSAAQAEVRASAERRDCVELFFGRSTAPGFFAYVIPLEGEKVRVGLASAEGSPLLLLRRFIRRRFRLSLPEHIETGVVLRGGPIKRTHAERVLAAGDCAGQTKPTTGGGVITGGLCGMIAGRVAAESSMAGDCSSKALARYEGEWRRALGGEFALMRVLRWILDVIPDWVLDRAFQAAACDRLLGAIREVGDIDLQGRTLIELAKSGRLLSLLPALAAAFAGLTRWA